MGYTQEALAQKLEVAESTVRRWELGKTDPRLSLWSDLAEALNLSLDALRPLLYPPQDLVLPHVASGNGFGVTHAGGFTQESLADKLSAERSTVGRWESGDTEPQPWCRPKIARALRLSPEQFAELLAETISDNTSSDARSPLRHNDIGANVAASRHIPRPMHDESAVLEEVETAKRRAFVAGGLAALSLGLTRRTSGRGSAGSVLAADMQTVSASYRRAYRTAPAQQLYSSVHEHMKLVLSLRPDDQISAVRTQLLVTAGEMAAVSATVLGLDLGRWSDAGPYLDLAHHAAREATHPELEAVVLACRAFHAAYGLNDKQLGLHFAEAAVTASRQGACNTTCGWVAAVASERHADIGNKTASHRRLDLARSALSAPPDERSWSGIGSFDLAKLTAYEGGNYRRLGDYGNAVRVLDTALSELDPGMRRHRTTALIDRAEAHHGAGHIDAACADTRAALVLVAETQHADTVHRAEKVARSVLATNTRDANELWNEVLTLKTTTMARAE
jgi:DNA-binding XRE family transcriptional regulator